MRPHSLYNEEEEETPLTEYAEEVRILHEAFKTKYADYICRHQGHFYHIRSTPDHAHLIKEEGGSTADYILILDDTAAPTRIALYDPTIRDPVRNSQPTFVEELNWNDPNLFAQIYKHLDRFIE